MVVDLCIDIDSYSHTRISYTLINVNKDNYELHVMGADLPKFKEIISNKEEINNAIEEVTKRFKYNKLINSIRYIEFSGEIEDCTNYINQNKEELKKYKIVACENINDNNIDYIKEKYKDFDYYVMPEQSSSILSVSEYEQKKGYLDNLVNNIKMFNLSPLESVILVYDLVKEKVYLKEGKNGLADESRDIYKILDNDKIVCAGYVNLFNKIMDKLGIKNMLVTVCGKDDKYVDKHARTCVYIEDDKYNISGVYFLDPTYDSKMFDNEVNYVYKYRYFMKSLEFFKNDNRSSNLREESLGFLNDRKVINLGEAIDEAIKIVDENKNKIFLPIFNSNGDKKLYEEYADARHMLKFFYLLFTNSSTDDKDEINRFVLENKEKIVESFNKRLDGLTFIEALTKVRYVENKCDSKKYPFNLDLIFNYSRFYGFELPALSQEERLLLAIFGEGKDKMGELKDRLEEEYNDPEQKDTKEYKSLQLYYKK